MRTSSGVLMKFAEWLGIWSSDGGTTFKVEGSQTQGPFFLRLQPGHAMEWKTVFPYSIQPNFFHSIFHSLLKLFSIFHSILMYCGVARNFKSGGAIISTFFSSVSLFFSAELL